MMRYSYYDKRDMSVSISRISKTLRKLGVKIDIKKCINEVVEGTVTKEEFDDKLRTVLRLKINPNNFRQKVSGNNIYLFCEIMELLGRKLEYSKCVNLWSGNHKWFELSTGEFDYKFWKSLSNKYFSLETELVADGQDTCIKINVAPLGDSAISISSDKYTEKDKFRHWDKVVIDFESNKQYVIPADGHPCGSVYVADKLINAYEVSLKNLCNVEQTEDVFTMSSFTHLIALQNAIKEYNKFNDAVKELKTVSGARRKVEKLHEPRISVVTNKDGKDTYIPVSELAIKRVYERKEWQGGHHSSPVPHDVSGHWREYKNGKRVWVKGYHKQSPKYNGEKGQKVYVLGK